MSALATVESGAPDGQTLIFLHGASETGGMWLPQTAALGLEYHCLVPDLPGHGASRGVKWRSFATSARQVGDLVRERANGGRAHVVGLSLGGYLALELLASQPERVAHAVVTGVHALPFPRARWVALAATLAAPVVRTSMARSAFARITREAVRYRLPDLSHARAPTLVLAGSRERALIRDSVPAIVAALPRAQGRIAPDAGHMWSREAPDLFNATLRSWLGGLPLPEALDSARTG